MSSHAPVAPLKSRCLVDSTVWSKVRVASRPELAEWFNAAVQADLVATCDVIVLELLRSARNTTAFHRQAEVLRLLPIAPVGEREFLRALTVQTQLAAVGTHRGVPPAELLIAAAAEAAQLPLLHYDRDFDLIAAATGQACSWFVPAGSLP